MLNPEQFFELMSANDRLLAGLLIVREGELHNDELQAALALSDDGIRLTLDTLVSGGVLSVVDAGEPKKYGFDEDLSVWAIEILRVLEIEYREHLHEPLSRLAAFQKGSLANAG